MPKYPNFSLDYNQSQRNSRLNNTLWVHAERSSAGPAWSLLIWRWWICPSAPCLLLLRLTKKRCTWWQIEDNWDQLESGVYPFVDPFKSSSWWMASVLRLLLTFDQCFWYWRPYKIQSIVLRLWKRSTVMIIVATNTALHL